MLGKDLLYVSKGTCCKYLREILTSCHQAGKCSGVLCGCLTYCKNARTSGSSYNLQVHWFGNSMLFFPRVLMFLVISLGVGGSVLLSLWLCKCRSARVTLSERNLPCFKIVTFEIQYLVDIIRAGSNCNTFRQMAIRSCSMQPHAKQQQSKAHVDRLLSSQVWPQGMEESRDRSHLSQNLNSKPTMSINV